MSVQDDTGVNRNLKNQRGQLQDVPTEHRHEPPQPSRWHKGADKHGVSVACALVSCESLTILYALVSDQCHMRACVCAGSGCEATMTMLTKMPACSCSQDGQTPSRHLTLGLQELEVCKNSFHWKSDFRAPRILFIGSPDFGAFRNLTVGNPRARARAGAQRISFFGSPNFGAFSILTFRNGFPKCRGRPSPRLVLPCIADVPGELLKTHTQCGCHASSCACHPVLSRFAAMQGPQ